VSELTQEQIAFVQSWRSNPKKFCWDVLRVETDAWQDDPLQAVLEHDQIALLGSKGVGKSFIEACIGLWWLITRPLAQVICTSKDADNLKDGLWKEIGALYQRSAFLKHLFTFNTERISAKENPVEWFMVARGWRKHADPVEQAQALAGKHGRAMMWLGDEAGSYGQAIVTSGSAMLANVVPGSGNEARIVLGGNTTDPAGPLGDIARDRTSWHVVTINGDPDNPKRSPRVSIEWARKEILKHGRNNPWVKVSVFAEFPDVGFSSLLGPNEISASIRRVYEESAYQHSQKRLMVDVARFGDDATVIGLRQGLKAGPFIEMRGADTQQVADRVMLALHRTKAEVVYVDETGVGSGVVDALRRHHVRVVGVNGSESPNEPDKFYNKRAETIWLAAQWVKEGGWLPLEPKQLLDEAVQPTYLFKNGLMIIEAKDQIKARCGKSPDFWDCFCLSFASPEVTTGDPFKILEMVNNARGGPGEFDPLRSLNRNNQVSADWDPLGSKL
jgi:hypothetical protein